MRLVRVAEVKASRADDGVEQTRWCEKSRKRNVPAADSLGERHEIRPCGRPPVRTEEAPGAPGAADRLVVDQQHTELIADLAHARVVLGRSEIRAAAETHHRLENEPEHRLRPYLDDLRPQR